MTETQERFLRTVLTRVALDSVVELHLFPPIRRGTLETGVAVIVTRLPSAPSLVPADSVAADEGAADEREADELATDERGAEDERVPDHVQALGEATDDVESEMVPDAATDSPYADEKPSGDAAVIVDGAATETEDVTADDASEEDVGAARTTSDRMRILTASYRHTIKGVERGKWTADVQEEADAPLEAVELVLRGVRHRSTEPADPELISLEVLRALIAPVAVAPAA